MYKDKVKMIYACGKASNDNTTDYIGLRHMQER